MGRHSAADDRDEVEAEAPVVVPAAVGGRGRHARTEDAEETGPVNGAGVRDLEERAAAQDDQPTERLGLEELLLEPPDEPAVPAEPAGLSTEAPAAEDVPVDAAPDQVTEPVAPAQPVPGAGPAGAPAASASSSAKGRPRGSQSTAADLALLRRRPDVRNRVIAAVVVPFVLYVVVLLLVGASGSQYLLWIWIPLVTAGVGAGLLLDTAHRKQPPEPAEPSG